MRQGQLQVKYVLFSHYSHEETADLRNFAADPLQFSQPQDATKLKGLTTFKRHLSGLGDLLDTPGYEGVLNLFYAPGFIDFLNGIGQGASREELLNSSLPLRFAEVVAAHARRLVTEAGIAQRIRIVTSLDLYEVLGSTHSSFAEHFQDFITGSAPGLRYDAPKLVEAIIRLRLLGTGIPVFRADQDVIFRDVQDESESSELGLFKALACSVEAYRLRLSLPSMATFLFSASYDSDLLKRTPRSGETFKAWAGAFATRVHPSLLANPTAIRATWTPSTVSEPDIWDDYIEQHTSDSLALRFYGLRRTQGMPRADGPDGLAGIARLGAPPLTAVISGALLSLSDGAILDLPPFSNFRHNVVWIDDHLKYSLHRAMSHFTSRQRMGSNEALATSRLEKVKVTKARPRTTDLPRYVFDTYLPTLLWGTIVDAWITPDPILKRRRANLGANARARWDAARMREPAGVLPKALSAALSKGNEPTPRELRALKVDLASRAIDRINKVRNEWMRLRSGALHTFASAWASGQVEKEFGSVLPAPAEDHLWQGIAPRLRSDAEVKKNNLTPMMADALNDLVEDAVGYITWTLRWPQFVQIIRSAPQGAFAADLGWQQW